MPRTLKCAIRRWLPLAAMVILLLLLIVYLLLLVVAIQTIRRYGVKEDRWLVRWSMPANSRSCQLQQMIGIWEESVSFPNQTDTELFRVKTESMSFLCLRRSARFRILNDWIDSTSKSVNGNLYSKARPKWSTASLACLLLPKNSLRTFSFASFCLNTTTIVGEIERSL